MKPVHLILLAMSLLLSNCEQKDCVQELNYHFYNENYKKIYGEWSIISINWAGSEYVIEPDFKSMIFEEINGFKLISNGNYILCLGHVEIFKQTNDTLIIELIPEIGNHLLTRSCLKLIYFFGDTLVLDEGIDCTDSYKYTFIRNGD